MSLNISSNKSIKLGAIKVPGISTSKKNSQDQSSLTQSEISQDIFISSNFHKGKARSNGADTFEINYGNRVDFKEDNLKTKNDKKKTSPTANAFLDVAEAILRSIRSIIKTVGFFINAILMIARYTQGSRLAQIAKTYSEAALADMDVRGNPDLLHRAQEIDTRAAGVKGEFDTMVQAWKDVLQGNKQANKDTHDHFKRG